MWRMYNEMLFDHQKKGITDFKEISSNVFNFPSNPGFPRCLFYINYK